MSNQFKVGDVCVFVTHGRPITNYLCKGRIHDGQEVTLIRYIPFQTWGEESEKGPVWEIDATDANGQRMMIPPHHLRKRPDDQPFSEWFRNTIITDLTDAPLETTMRNVAKNLQKFTTDQEASNGR